MSSVPTVLLNDGASIPRLGLGVMFVPTDDLPTLIGRAVGMGYRLFDTAVHYGNEAGVGEAMSRLDVPRDQVTVTTKLPNGAHGHDETLRSFDVSERALGQIDLYLVHWPQPVKRRYLDSWRAMVRLREEGRVRSIGVCNFTEPLLDELIAQTGVAPAVNQIERHPQFPQVATCAANAARGVATESWSPLAHGRVLDDPTVRRIANEHQVPEATVVLRWHLDTGAIVIPKASSPAHLADGLRAIDIQLSADERAELDALARPNGGFGPDPMLHVSDQGAATAVATMHTEVPR